jgi:hypothetical protein
MTDGGLAIWVVYDHPPDFPTEYVARMQIAGKDGVKITDQIMTSKSLDLLRSELEARGLTCLMRMEGDDPKIVETWL